MKNKYIVIPLVLMLAVSMLTVLMHTAKADTNLTLSDPELYDEFSVQWGPGSITKTDITGTGVQFNFTGLTDPGDTEVGDNWEISQKAGGALHEGVHYSDFTAFTHYRLVFNNSGTGSLKVSIYLHTGYTSPNLVRDTFWGSGWFDLAAGEARVLTLDFSSVGEVWNANDDLELPHHPGGASGIAIWRLEEVTHIGFGVLGSGAGSLVVSALTGSETMLSMNPYIVQKGYSDVSSTFPFTVNIASVTDLFGFEIKITWDSSVLTTAPVVSYTSLLDEMWGLKSAEKWDDPIHELSAGSYRLVATKKGVLEDGFTGTHDLITLTFTVDSPGDINWMKTSALRIEVHKLSDKSSNEIDHIIYDGTYRIWGVTPVLDMTSPDDYCRELDEEYKVKVAVSNEYRVLGVALEIKYDTLLLDYVGYTGDWAGATYTVTDDSGAGTVKCTITHTTELDGPGPNDIITIKFEAVYAHIRKQVTGYVNDLTGNDYFANANLTYADSYPILQYLRGGSANKVNVGYEGSGGEMVYTFSPIQGDVNNDGEVAVFDLVTVAGIYDSTSSVYNLVGPTEDGLIDIFDLVYIASNFWTSYDPILD
jgi:hypothetical protein